MASSKKNLCCSFCGKPREEVKKLIAGPKVYICNECITISYNILRTNHDTEPLDTKEIPSPSQIKKHLDKHVIGHDSAKELLSVSAYNHYKRVFSGQTLHLEKSNVLMLGSTGSGKTLMAKTLADMLRVPFAIADATTLTEAGYMGEDVESVLERLLSITDYDIAAAERGVIYIDEMDKKARSTESHMATKDISGEGVQQALLRLIEGTVAKVSVSGKPNKRTPDVIEFDTTNVLFIVGGAFVGIEDFIMRRRQANHRIGFDAKIESKTNRRNLQYLIHEDVIKYGLIPELVGRLPVIATLETLGVEQLIDVLTKAENNVLSQNKALFELDDIELEFGCDYIKECAERAAKQKTGARALKTIVENTLVNVMFRAPELKKRGVVRIVFDKYPDQVATKPILVYNNGKESVDRSYKLYRGNDEKTT